MKARTRPNCSLGTSPKLNTPAVCRSSYIDPRVFDRFRGGITIQAVGEVESVDPATMPMLHGKVEEAVLDLLEDETPTAKAA